MAQAPAPLLPPQIDVTVATCIDLSNWNWSAVQARIDRIRELEPNNTVELPWLAAPGAPGPRATAVPISPLLASGQKRALAKGEETSTV
jgi:hypothetical protein